MICQSLFPDGETIRVLELGLDDGTLTVKLVSGPPIPSEWATQIDICYPRDAWEEYIVGKYEFMLNMTQHELDRYVKEIGH